MNIFREIKQFIQRGKRGWADCDVWDARDYLSRLIPEMLEHLKNNNVGCPNEYFCKSNKNNECEKWENELQIMIDGFKAIKKIEDLDFCCLETKKEAKEEYEHLTKTFNKGMDSLKENFLSLWD